MVNKYFCQGCLPHHSKEYERVFQGRPCVCTCHVPGGKVYGRRVDADIGAERYV